MKGDAKLATRNRQHKKKNQLSEKDRSSLFVTGILCTSGAVLLCIEGWISWVGTVLYLVGIVNWLTAAFRSEKVTVVDHEEIMRTVPAFFIWLLWGKTYVSMDYSCLIVASAFSLIIAALFVFADWRRKRRSTKAEYIGWSLLTILLIYVFVGVPFITQTNVQLDLYEKKTYEGTVIETERKTSTKSTTKYSADVSFVDNDGKPQQETIRIQRSQYQQIAAGQKVIVIEGHGLYGAGYWMIDLESQD